MAKHLWFMQKSADDSRPHYQTPFGNREMPCIKVSLNKIRKP